MSFFGVGDMSKRLPTLPFARAEAAQVEYRVGGGARGHHGRPKIFASAAVAIATLIRCLRGQLHAFRLAERGNITITFTLALIPIVASVGAAVDYSRAASARTAMQSAIDATALMLSKNIGQVAPDQLSTKATTYFNTLFHHDEVSGVQLNAEYTTSGGSQIVLNGSGTVSTTFMRVMGISTVNINVSSTVKWGNTRLRVALVLDITGSMNSSGKLNALKSATKNLLTQLQSAAVSSGDVYVSIIPFSKNVNVGKSNYSATWLDFTDWKSEPQILKTWIPNNSSTWERTGPNDGYLSSVNNSCPFSKNTHGFGCLSGPTGTSTVSNIPSSGTYAGYICPGAETGDTGDAPGYDRKIGIIYNGCYRSVRATRTISTGWGASCGTQPNCSCSGSGSTRQCTQKYYEHPWRDPGTPAAPEPSARWQGCITDRGTSTAPSQDYDRKVTSPSTSIPETLFPAEQNYYCSDDVMMGLNYNWSAMKSFVDSFSATGATNQPIGLVWGWQSLVGGGPLTAPPKDANYTYNEVIVLMSDGLNTLDRWYGNGSDVETSVDKRMYESATVGTCANIKAAGITVYTVHVNTDGDPMSTLLKNCASSPDKFWMVTSAGELGTVFGTIGTALSNLRVAK